jgi:hypothetical protein
MYARDPSFGSDGLTIGTATTFGPAGGSISVFICKAANRRY